jgi:quercetin dioxygenase-like cupin family protein
MQTEEQVREQLTNEGFAPIYVWEDVANAEYPEHTHEKLTAHVVLKGEITLTDKSGTKILKEGERFDIPAGTTHSAKCGPDGCKFVVGEK